MEIIDEYKVLKVLKQDSDMRVCEVEKNGQHFILKQAISSDKSTINTLKNEFISLCELKETDIVPKIIGHNFTTANYIVMEKIDGYVINRVTTTKYNKLIILMIKIANSVAKLHEMGIVHGDLKQANILLCPDNSIKLIDFSISLNSHKYYFKNYISVEYCSKWQLLKEDLTFKTDIYALSVILYKKIYGEFPFRGSKEEIKRKKLNDDFHPAENQKLNAIFLKAFNIDGKKYNDINEFIQDLKQILVEISQL